MTVAPIVRLRVVRRDGYRCKVRSHGIACGTRGAHVVEVEGELVTACSVHALTR